MLECMYPPENYFQMKIMERKIEKMYSVLSSSIAFRFKMYLNSTIFIYSFLFVYFFNQFIFQRGVTYL